MKPRTTLHYNKRDAIFFIAACFIAFGSMSCSTARSVNSEQASNTLSTNSRAININTATADELENIPHIGVGLAAKIVEYRMRYGPFRKAEHIMLIDGISDKRFREIREFIKVE